MATVRGRSQARLQIEQPTVLQSFSFRDYLPVAISRVMSSGCLFVLSDYASATPVGSLTPVNFVLLPEWFTSSVESSQKRKR